MIRPTGYGPHMRNRSALIASLAAATLLGGTSAASAALPTNGDPETVCSASDTTTPDGEPASPDALIGEWVVASIGTLDTTAVGPTIEFTPEGTVHGFAGVNRFNGNYTATDGQIEFGPLRSTLMAGPDDAMLVEQCLLSTLVDSQPATFGDGVLTIGSGDRSVTAHPAASAAPGVVTVSGTVTYLERVALPEGAVVTVQINDVSLADAPSVTVAEAVITPFHQVPIPFAIAVSGSAFEDGHTYSLSVRISIDGELLFTTADHLPVTNDYEFHVIDVLVTGVQG